jgi:putative aldouronate transport system permease protein
MVVVLLSVFTLLIVFPLYYVIALSFTTYSQYIKSSGLVLIVHPISLDGYAQFLRDPTVPRAFLVTVFVTIVGTILNLAFTVTMAYPLSRKELPCRKFFSLFVFIPMVFSGGLIPTFYVVRQTGIINSVWALILPALVSCYNLTVTRSFMQSIDNSYIEAARIDGAGELAILLRIMIPLAKPVLATILLMYGVAHWNTYFAALYYIRTPDLQPLQVVLRGLLMQAQSTMEETSADITASSQAMKQAAVVLTALPIVVVYPLLQKHFTKGLLLGGVKG